ncbi:MAG: hypothetical protein HOP29_08570 [Phycisphaerales bacterium]|nr:hypothetical protein [Phycisphaerales bacterium]
MAENQPCWFGKMEAKARRLAFCILTENDIERGDDHVRAAIQAERLDWKRRAASGESHGFLIVVVSERVATARPNGALQRLAQRLCELYLGADAIDEIHLDDLILELDANGVKEWRRWRVGANFFSSQGDGRWWRDHRIPGGIAFSMNSVGHMARNRVEVASRRKPELAARCAALPREKLAYWALPTAMNTIGAPVQGGTRGTWLAKRGEFPEDRDTPWFETARAELRMLAEYSENRYKGLYHTDHTIPTVYFNEALTSREHVSERDDLFFTYLHSASDEAFESMGLGIEWTRDDRTEPTDRDSDRSER